MVLFTMPVFAVKADTIGPCSFILNENPLSELKSLEIMPDESITIFIEDPRGYDDSFKQIILEKEQQTDYNCGHITFKDIKGCLSYLSNKEFIAPLKKEEKTILNSLFPSYKLDN